MRPTTPAANLFFPAWLLLIFLSGSGTSFAQSLGDIARQQRTQGSARSSNSPHVYTNEDLTREKILDPADQDRLSAKVPAASPVGIAAPTLDATASSSTPAFSVSAQNEGEAEILPPVPAWPAGTPLGDVARYYRLQKQLRTAPLQEPVVARSKRVPTPPAAHSPVTPAPRRNVARGSPEQPAQKPKQIVATTEPVFNQLPQLPRVIQVNSGDSLWKLASRYLGDGKQWREIASANPQIANPDRIRAGEQIVLPAATVSVAATQIRVQAGDSLWKLARAQWGSGQAWSCIVESNPQIEPASSRIYPGQVLTLPASCSRAA
jgi:nucleoid-associated protein YgaU